MRKNNVLVTISTLALSAFPFSKAQAVVQITCPGANRIQLGRGVECTSVNTRFTIRPQGGFNINAGCVVFVNNPQRGQCTIFNTGAPTSRSVRVSFPSTPVVFNDGGNTIRLNRFRMRRTTAGPNAAAITFSPTEVNNTVRVFIGARVRVRGNGNSLGSYVGTIIVNATPL